LGRPGSGVASRTISARKAAPSASPGGGGAITASVPSSSVAIPAIRVSLAATTAPARRPGSSIAASTMAPPSTRIARFSPIPSS